MRNILDKTGLIITASGNEWGWKIFFDGNWYGDTSKWEREVTDDDRDILVKRARKRWNECKVKIKN